MTAPLDALVAAVQTNCHIADAAHATDLTLCTYLLQMREFYRWEQRLPYGATLARDAVGTWLAEREAAWAGLEGRAFVPVPMGPGGGRGVDVDAFDVARINDHLLPQGLVYGAGLAAAGRAGFFLARLDQLRVDDTGLALQVCGAELARGLFAPPAVLQGDTIVLRRESFARWLWEQFEAYGLKRAEGPFKAVATAYGLERDFDAALPRMLDELGEVLILHERGEHIVGRRLGPGWAALRLALNERRTELQVRAVRDQLADLTLTLPTLLQRRAELPLHFWFAGFDGLRKALFPSLPAAYRAWCQGDGGVLLRCASQRGAVHFWRLAEQVLALHARWGEDAGPQIGTLLSATQAVCPGD